MNAINYTCKIPVNNSDNLCIINSEWSNTEIKLLLLHDNQAWSGMFQMIENDDLTELLDQLSLSQDAFIEESRKALTTHGGADNFGYTIEKEKFTWKKYVRKNMSVKFGNVNLSEVPLFEAFGKVIDNTLKSNLTFYSKLQNSDKERESLVKENDTLKSKLNELVEKKNEMEISLYSQFLHLLNEKKRKIKELKKKMPAEDCQDVLQSESDHFDSDTELDSEVDEKPSVSLLTLEGSGIDLEDDPVTLPKRSRQKRPNESTAGPSGENTRAKNSKVVLPKKQSVKSKNGHGKSGKDVIGQISEVKVENLSEASEDVFAFQKCSKRTVSATRPVKPTTSKIKYGSDEDIDIDNVENRDCDMDKTLSQIDQAGSNGNLDLEQMEKNEKNNESLIQRVGGQKMENKVTKDEPKEGFGSRQLPKKSGYKGLSSSTLDILNQLV